MHQRKDEDGNSDGSSPITPDGRSTPVGVPYPVGKASHGQYLANNGLNNHPHNISSSNGGAAYSGLSTPERYNMPRPSNNNNNNTSTPFQSSSSGVYPTFGSSLVNYGPVSGHVNFVSSSSSSTAAAAAAGTHHDVGHGDGAGGEVHHEATSNGGLASLPPYHAGGLPPFATTKAATEQQYGQDGYASNRSSARGLSHRPFSPPVIQYPPAQRNMRDLSASPSYHEVASTWQGAGHKDATESNVRGSDMHVALHGAGAQTQNDYSLKANDGSRFPDGAAQLDIHHHHHHQQHPYGTSGTTAEGLQSWLAVSQQSNPVNSILRLEGPRHMAERPFQLMASEPLEPIRHLTPFGNTALGRYSKVEQTWYSRLSSQGRWRGAEKRWYDVLHGMKGDLFNCSSPVCPLPDAGRRAQVSEACRVRMINAIYPVVNNPYNPAAMAATDERLREEAFARFPSCAAFDEALDKYFESFLREAPFLHMPIFSISTCHPLLLFVMSCIGFGLNKTAEGCLFVQSNFNCVRDRIIGELERKLASSTKDAMSIFATSFLFLKLAALINDRDHLSPCQLLYISLVSLAQMHGMFSEYGKRTDSDMYNGLNSLEERWAAWGRVESLKRISIGLMRVDSAYGTFLKSAPAIRVAHIEVLLPCDDRLFEARTAQAWYELLEDVSLPITMPAIHYKNSLDRLVGTTYLNYYSLHSVLNYLQLRSLDAYQKLLDYQSAQESEQFILVPFQYYITEPSLHSMTLHVVAFIDSYETLVPHFAAEWQRINCLVFWHFLCLSLTMNQDLFEIAAGREGPRAAASAIDSIATWSRTPAARRALIHSASIYQLLSHHSLGEKSSLYAAFATFAAALVMTLYVFANPGIGGEEAAYELTADVSWAGFGLAGLNESVVTTNGSAAENFILLGGASTFMGRTLQGFTGARYVLDLYADMLKGCGRYNYRQMSQILFMMSDLLQSANE